MSTDMDRLVGDDLDAARDYVAGAITEADQEDYKQQEGEERHRAFLERRAMMGGPDAPDRCSHCGGNGSCMWNGADHGGVNCDDPYDECPHCLGTGVQP